MPTKSADGPSAKIPRDPQSRDVRYRGPTCHNTQGARVNLSLGTVEIVTPAVDSLVEAGQDFFPARYARDASRFTRFWFNLTIKSPSAHTNPGTTLVVCLIHLGGLILEDCGMIFRPRNFRYSETGIGELSSEAPSISRRVSSRLRRAETLGFSKNHLSSTLPFRGASRCPMMIGKIASGSDL